MSFFEEVRKELGTRPVSELKLLFSNTCHSLIPKLL